MAHFLWQSKPMVMRTMAAITAMAKTAIKVMYLGVRLQDD